MKDTPLNTRPSHGGNIEWAAQIAKCSPFALLDFSASINPLGPPPAAIAAIQANLTQLKHYPNPSYPELRQLLAAHHHLSPDWILPGNGAAELLTWAGRDLAKLDSTYLVTPAFGDYGRSLHAFDAAVTPCPLPLAAAEAGQVDWMAVITQALQHDPARCGLLLNSPHNPTGLVISPATLTRLLEQFALVVLDEAFMDFLPPEQQCSLISQVQRWPNLVILRSLTKFYSLPGLRIGYAIAHPNCLQRWQQWRDPWSVNTLAAIAAQAALQDRDFQVQTWQWLSAARSQLMRQLPTIAGLHPLPGAANYLLIRVERPGSHMQLELLQRHQILIRDCLSFPELGDQYIRIAVRTEAENRRLLKALKDVMEQPG